MWMLLHGFTGSPASWHPVVSQLPDPEAVVRPTLLGHGPGWEKWRVATFEDEVNRLSTLLHAMQRPRWLCGYSLGARLALGIVARGTTEIDGVVLIGAHPGLRDEAARAARRAEDARRASALRRHGVPAFVDEWESLPLFDTQQVLPSRVLDAQRADRLAHDPEGLAASLEVLGLAEMPCFTDVLTKLCLAPVWVAGERDPKFAAIARQASPNAVIVPTVGHNVVLEAPDAVVSILRTVERDFDA